MDLFVVESPTKIKTLSRLLDESWSFAVTKGHLYDLPEDRMGLDDEYEPDWVPVNRRTVNQLESKTKQASRVFLASDPDREGEAIAWQVKEFILNDVESYRIRLESITEPELEEQLEDPGGIDVHLVEAQWARRLLDRLAGYKISPFLVNAFDGKKLSAGRVQTPVLGKIVDRWREVEAFEPETFYTISFDWFPASSRDIGPFEAELVRISDRPIGTDEDRELLTDEDLAETISTALEENGAVLTGGSRQSTISHPRRPFSSSSLIKAASGWYNWSASRTMTVAQSLYEKGLITYHRSDSNRLSREACRRAAGYINDAYGSDVHQWRGGGEGDQEGHEAIRPKYPGLVPEELHSVSASQRTLYAAIWQRTVRSQMVPAEWDVLTLEFLENINEAYFESDLRSLVEPGFYRCRRSGETPKEEEFRRQSVLDDLERIEAIDIDEIRRSSSRTKGPDNYTEGALVSMMKEEGIGRPSTYGSTIERLLHRQYIRREDGSILPTERGCDVVEFLRRAVPKICEIDFTGEMENTLDDIASGNTDWNEFVESFDKRLDEWLESGKDLEPEGSAESHKERLGYAACPRCDGELWLREGQYGEFVHCENEECDFSSNPPAKTYRCPECDRHMVKRKGSRSTVYHCLSYPNCDGRRPVGEPNMTYEEFRKEAPDCPECEDTMVKRKGRYGTFWGCENYPDCDGTRTMN